MFCFLPFFALSLCLSPFSFFVLFTRRRTSDITPLFPVKSVDRFFHYEGGKGFITVGFFFIPFSAAYAYAYRVVLI